MILDGVNQRLVQRGLIPFQCHHVVSARFNHLFRDRFLSSDGINRDDCPFDINQLQQLRDCCDLIGVCIRRTCPKERPAIVSQALTRCSGPKATLGSTDTIENDGQELRMSGLVTATSDKALQVVAQSDKGQRWQASIGVRVGDVAEIPAGQVVVVNKQEFRGPVLVARNSQMYETSVLPAGADWTTRVNLAARVAKTLQGEAAGNHSRSTGQRYVQGRSNVAAVEGLYARVPPEENSKNGSL